MCVPVTWQICYITLLLKGFQAVNASIGKTNVVTTYIIMSLSRFFERSEVLSKYVKERRYFGKNQQCVNYTIKIICKQ